MCGRIHATLQRFLKSVTTRQTPSLQHCHKRDWCSEISTGDRQRRAWTGNYYCFPAQSPSASLTPWRLSVTFTESLLLKQSQSQWCSSRGSCSQVWPSLQNTGQQLPLQNYRATAEESLENSEQFNISCSLKWDQPAAADISISNIMHVHDLADIPNMTQQGNLLGTAGAFLDRSYINRTGIWSDVQGTGHSSKGSGSLGKRSW